MLSLISLFDRHATLSLELFRIAIGLVLTFDFLRFFRHAELLAGQGSVISLDVFLETPRRGLTLFQFPAMARSARWVFMLGAVAAACLAAGALTKVALVGCVVVLNSAINRNRLLFNGGHSLAATLLFFCLFSPMGESLSVDSLVKPLRSLDVGWAWAQQACKAQMTLMYWGSFLAKLLQRDWREGTLVYKVVSHGIQRTRLPMPRFFQVLLVSKLLTFSVMGAELALPVLLWWGPTSVVAVIALAALHLSMNLYLDVGAFSFYAIAGTLLFLPL